MLWLFERPEAAVESQPSQVESKSTEVIDDCAMWTGRLTRPLGTFDPLSRSMGFTVQYAVRSKYLGRYLQ